MALAALLMEATEALSRLDAERLEALQERALAVQAVLQGEMGAVSGGVSPEELQARFRVFARVVDATEANLRILQPRGAWCGYGAGARDRWAH